MVTHQRHNSQLPLTPTKCLGEFTGVLRVPVWFVFTMSDINKQNSMCSTFPS